MNICISGTLILDILNKLRQETDDVCKLMDMVTTFYSYCSFR